MTNEENGYLPNMKIEKY